MKQKEKDMEIIGSHLVQLGEHFDSVHIFVTRHEAGEEDGTINANQGSGNWFARYGQIHNWLIKQDEITRLDAREIVP